MGTTAEEGPLGTFGKSPQDIYAPPNASNPESGPCFWFQGDMLLDPRGPYTYWPGNRTSTAALPVFGWPTATNIPLIDQAPSTASATNIASATPSSGTALALVSSSGAGITVGCSVINANTGLTVSGLLGIDVAAARTFTGVFTNGSPKITWSAAPGGLGIQVGDQVTLTTSGTLPTGFAVSTTYYVVAVGGSVTIGSGAFMLSATLGGVPISAGSAGSGTQTINVTAPNTYNGGTGAATINAPNLPFQPPVIFGKGGDGLGGPIRFWNPNWAISRGIVVTANGVDTSGTYTIAGYDIYGYPLTQTLTGTSSSTATTTKAFKYIASVTPNGTIGSTTLTVGTVDVFGLPLRTDWATYLNVYWNNALITPANAVLVAADINTPTALTGDVRGTITATATSDGTKRLVVFWNPTAANMNSQTGMLGQPQF